MMWMIWAFDPLGGLAPQRKIFLWRQLSDTFKVSDNFWHSKHAREQHPGVETPVYTPPPLYIKV